MVPSSRMTSASMVGLPRLSRISRARMSTIWDIESECWCQVLGLDVTRVARNACAPRSRGSFSHLGDRILVRPDAVQIAHRVGHSRPDAHHQFGTIVVGQAFRLYRVEEVHVDDAGPNAERTLRHHLARAMDDRRDDRTL